MTPADLTRLVEAHANEPPGKGPEYALGWMAWGEADDWLAEHAPDLACICVAQHEALRRIEHTRTHHDDRGVGDLSEAQGVARAALALLDGLVSGTQARANAEDSQANRERGD